MDYMLLENDSHRLAKGKVVPTFNLQQTQTSICEMCDKAILSQQQLWCTIAEPCGGSQPLVRWLTLWVSACLLQSQQDSKSKSLLH